MKSKKTLLVVACALAAAPTIISAATQPANPSQTSAKNASSAVTLMLEEIVVSARRKNDAEQLQDVPLAISAVSSSQMDAAFIEDLTDIGLMAPNVNLDPVGSVPGVASFFIRGMGVNSSVPSDDPAVGVFVDGMFLGVNYGAVTDTFDLESVEVLRGPQGTLFGRNVTGGAVLLRSKRPEGEFGFKVKGVLGSHQRRDLSVALEGTLVEQTLAGKIAVMSKDHEGYFDNLAIPGDKIGDDQLLVVRPILVWTPADTITVTMITEWGDQDSDGAPTENLVDKTGAASITAQDDFDLTHDFKARSGARWKHIIGEVNWDLEQGTLTAEATWRELEQNFSGDIDGTDAPVLHFVDSGIEQDQQSLELVYAGDLSEQIDITTGFYYFTQDVDYREGRDIFGGAVQQRGNGILDHTAIGIFAQSDVALSDRWTLTLGGRYTSEEKDAKIASFNECTTDYSCNYSFEDSESWSGVTPKVGLRWFAAQDVQVYTSWSQGFRSGGFNLRNASSAVVPGPYDEEKVKASELGIKWTLPEGRGHFNLAAFQNEFSGLQRTVLNADASQQILNAADASITGIEADFMLLLVENLLINASLGYLDAGFDSFVGLDVNGDGTPDPDLARDLDLVRVPEWTRYISATYDLPLEQAGSLTLRASYSFTDSRAGNDANGLDLNAYELFDASATWADVGGRFKVSAFGKNLTNEHYAAVAVDVSLFTQQYIAPPRTWGIELTYEY
jgi:iron complex outermembrane recepter protein